MITLTWPLSTSCNAIDRPEIEHRRRGRNVQVFVCVVLLAVIPDRVRQQHRQMRHPADRKAGMASRPIPADMLGTVMLLQAY